MIRTLQLQDLQHLSSSCSEQIARGETSHSPTDSSHEHLFYLNPLFARNIYKYKAPIYNIGGLIWKSM
jgi:hypothetical protein